MKPSALRFLPALLAAATSTALADGDTTATLKGSVDVDNATVAIVYEPTGLSKSSSLGDGNNFSFSFLPVGGPYTITVSAPGFESETIEEVYLAFYQNEPINVRLDDSDMEEILVTGKAADAQSFGTGTTLDRYAIDGVPTVDRSIADYARLDPRVNINAASSNIQISAMGVNNRYNDFQIDGVSYNDPFGLNASGFGSLRNPISMDFVQQISVDLTPYDVSRAGATGATISAITKSGSNEFDGSLYYTKRDEGNVGDLPDGSKFPPFEEEIFAATLSGPIIEDKLFFFVGYEEFEKTQPFTYGPAGSGALNESNSATAAVFDEIASIAQSVYGFDPGGYQNLSFPESSEEYTAKLDWYIDDNHRVELLHIYKEEVNYNNIGLNKFASVVYTKPPETERTSFTYYGDWSEGLRVKFRYTDYSFVEDAESGGGLFPEVRITYNGAGGRDYIYLGGEKYRGANYIDVSNESYSFKFDYTLGEHLITGGVVYEEGTVINQFLARYNGEVRFNSIQDFEDGQWSYLRFQVPTAGLDDLDSITANFDVEKTSYYLQDVWSVSDSLDWQFGVRVDSLKTPTKPVENSAFVDAYGFSNARAFDYTVVQPRVSFRWDVTEGTDFELPFVDNIVLRGGYGLFMGRFPNVWLGNAYSRPGPLSDYKSYYSFSNTIGLMPSDAEFFWLTSEDSSYTIAPPGSSSASQYVAKGFEAPSTWRASLAADIMLEGGWDLTLELNQDRVRQALSYEDPGLEQIGSLADGRGVYDGSGSLGLTNIGAGGATAFTASLNKYFDNGFRLYSAYTYSDSEDVWNLTSSQAESNYGYQERFGGDPMRASTSQYNVEHRFLAVLDYAFELFGDNETRVSLIFERKAGENYSVTFDGDSLSGLSYDGYDLAYIPSGVSDPNVEFSSAAVADAVMAHINGTALAGYKGQVAPRGAFTSPWTSRADLRITQEFALPEFSSLIGENKILVYLDVLNLGNLIDDNYGVVKEYSYNSSRQIVTDGYNEDGQIIITGVDPDDNLFTNAGEGKSSWEMRLGFKYKF
jgi:hypothetical protein